tara:strand:+ start:1359 stop:1529 length:171 start_codon:yes stop_codon:yes gene_type:complete
MGLDALAALLIYIAIWLEGNKKEDTGSSLDNFGIKILQAVLTGIAFILEKLNPFIW